MRGAIKWLDTQRRDALASQGSWAFLPRALLGKGLFWASVGGRVCALHLLDDEGACEQALKRVRARWPECVFERGVAQEAGVLEAVQSALGGQAWELPLVLRGSVFERAVWAQLLELGNYGQCVSYGDVARALGKPTASRAVGGAVGRNPVAVLVPCHRVLGAGGRMGGYAWGVPVKRALLEKEGVSLCLA